jgi:hypothetical protein
MFRAPEEIERDRRVAEAARGLVLAMDFTYPEWRKEMLARDHDEGDGDIDAAWRNLLSALEGTGDVVEPVAPGDARGEIRKLRDALSSASDEAAELSRKLAGAASASVEREIDARKVPPARPEPRP